MHELDCLFCEKFSHKPTAIENRKWYDIPVLEDEDFLAVPALGELVPGYLLIITRRHVLSMALLSKHEIQKLSKFCEEVIRFQTRIWGATVIFEHGVCKEDKPSGACINHAHWHLVPGDYKLLPEHYDFVPIVSFENYAINKQSSSQYLFYSDGERNEYVLENSEVQSQFFRRILASKIGRPDEWDYLVFPFFENIRVTFDQISPYSKAGSTNQ